MPDAAPPALPFDEPSIEVAVREYVDVLNRLDAVEKQLQATHAAVGEVRKQLGTAQADLGRLANASTAQGLGLERIERQNIEMLKLLRGVR